MLPFDNKSEFQVIVDMPNGTTLEQTARVTEALARGGHEAARGGQPADLRGHGLAVQLQRPGAALLPAPRLERGRHPGEPAAQARPQDCRATRSPSPCATGCCPWRSATARASRWPKCRPARPCSRRWWPRSTARRQQGQIDLARQHPRPLQADRRRGGRGLVRGRRPAQVPARWWTRRRPRSTASPRTISPAPWPSPRAGYAAGLLHADAEKEDVPITRAARPRLALRPRTHPGAQGGRAARAALVALARTGAAGSGDRGQEHLPQEPDAGDLRDRRRGGRHGKPGLRHPQARPGDRQVQDPGGLRHRAAHGRAAGRSRPLLHEVGRRVAHHLRGLPRSRASPSPPC